MLKNSLDSSSELTRSVFYNVKSNVYCDKLWRERGAALQCSRAGFGSLLGVQVEYWSSGSGRKSGICLIAKMGALEFGDKSAYCRNGSPGEIRTLVGGSKARYACPLQSAESDSSLHRASPGYS